METLINEIYNNVMEGQSEVVAEKVQAALQAGIAPAVILNEGMIAAMGEVGRLYETGEYFVPEMLVAAHAMQAGMALLKPHLLSSDLQSAGKVVIGAVEGDLHDIGKNLVIMMLEGSGFEVIDLGTGVLPRSFVQAVREHQPHILAMSALLTVTMPAMQATIAALQEAGLREQVKVLVGGAPVTEEFAAQIGADGYAPDASRAAGVARSLVR